MVDCNLVLTDSLPNDKPNWLTLALTELTGASRSEGDNNTLKAVDTIGNYSQIVISFKTLLGNE